MTPDQLRELADALDEAMFKLLTYKRTDEAAKTCQRAADYLRAQAEPKREPTEQMDVEAWAELHQLRAERGPGDGSYATWKDAAVAERIRRVRAEKALVSKSEPTEAQIEARDALLDFISENGTASEGVQYYLDRYVRAALAAKDEK